MTIDIEQLLDGELYSVITTVGKGLFVYTNVFCVKPHDDTCSKIKDTQYSNHSEPVHISACLGTVLRLLGACSPMPSTQPPITHPCKPPTLRHPNPSFRHTHPNIQPLTLPIPCTLVSFLYTIYIYIYICYTMHT